jgi:hypothetical protein
MLVYITANIVAAHTIEPEASTFHQTRFISCFLVGNPVKHHYFY